MRDNNILGFVSMWDFLESLLRLKGYVINGTFALVATLTTFITGYMWDSAEAVWTLWALMGFDWFTGIGKSIKSGSFVSYKVFRMPIYYLATSCIISLSWHMSKGNIVFIPLPAIAMGGFYAVYFSSLIENIAELGWLPKRATDLLKRFGMKVVIDKYFNKDKDV
jgi:hypothetical protein